MAEKWWDGWSTSQREIVAWTPHLLDSACFGESQRDAFKKQLDTSRDAKGAMMLAFILNADTVGKRAQSHYLFNQVILEAGTTVESLLVSSMKGAQPTPFSPEIHGHAAKRIDMSHWKAPNDDAKAWTALLSSAHTPEELERTLIRVLAIDGLMSRYHLTASLSKLASFHTYKGKQISASNVAKRVLPLLVVRAREQMGRLQARSLATLSHCLGTIEHKDKDLMMEIVKVSELLMSDFTTQGLSNLLWGFAKVDLPPTQRWMEAFLGACQSQLAEFKPQEISLVLWSLARLKYRLSPAKMQEILLHTMNNISSYNSHSISTVLWSLGSADHKPDDKFLLAIANEMIQPRKLALFTHQGLSQSLWALSRLKFNPDDNFKTIIVSQIRIMYEGGSDKSKDSENKFNAIDLATFAYSYAALNLPTNDKKLLQLMYRATFKSMSSLKGNHLAQVLWSFAKLSQVPSKTWLDQIFTSIYRHIGTLNARDLSMVAWSLAKLSVFPPRQFLAPFVDRVEVLAGEFEPRQISNTLWALACFNIRPSTLLLAQFFQATDQRLSSYKSSELCQMLWSLADRKCGISFGSSIDKNWVNEFLKVTFLRMPDFTPQGLSSLAWGLHRLNISPPPAWLYSFTNACRGKLTMRKLSALDLGSIINGLRGLNEKLELQKIEDFLLDALDTLSSMEVGGQEYARSQLLYLQRMRVARVHVNSKGQEDTANEHLEGSSPPLNSSSCADEISLEILRGYCDANSSAADMPGQYRRRRLHSATNREYCIFRFDDQEQPSDHL